MKALLLFLLLATGLLLSGCGEVALGKDTPELKEIESSNNSLLESRIDKLEKRVERLEMEIGIKTDPYANPWVK